MDIIHAYLRYSEHDAGWHPILFAGLIKYPQVLCDYIESVRNNSEIFSWKHKQMLLHLTNASAKNPTVFSELINGLKIGETLYTFSVNYFGFFCFI